MDALESRRGSRVLSAGNVYLAVVFLLLYAPILYLIYYSFNSGGNMHTFESFTLEWYGQVLQDTRLIIIVLNTVVIALLSSAIATVVGVAGRYTQRREQRLRNTLFT